MSFQTRDACRLGIDKSYIHELEDAKIHQPVQCVIVVVSAVCGPFSKENRTNNDGRFKLVIKIKVVAATNAYSVAGWDCDLSLIHISEPTRLGMISYAVF